MKILQMIPAFYPAVAYGGTVNVAYYLSKGLAKRNHEVTVYTSDTLDKDRRQKENFAAIDGINVYYFKNISNRLAWARFVLNTGVISALRKNLNKFDIIHLHGYRNFQNFFCYYYAKKHNIPYIVQAHGSLPYLNQKQLIKKSIDSIIGYRLLQDASRVIALHKTEADQYKKMGVAENKIEIIPNGIDLSEYESLPERGQFRNKYHIRNNEKIILYLGRIHKIKGIDLLINAYSKLVKDIEETKLVIVGPDDGFLSELKKQATELGMEGKVLFTGSLFDHDKLSAYVDADVFVLPSYYDCYPVTVLEAMACGTPVIITKNTGIVDVVNEAAYTVNCNNYLEFSNIIQRVLQDSTLRSNMSKIGRHLIQNELNWDNIVTKVEEVYEDCIHNV
jgi:glycosyltransferase involved in cell wall biosynthesis